MAQWLDFFDIVCYNIGKVTNQGEIAMITVNQLIYRLIYYGVDKDGCLIINLRETNAACDIIYTIAVPLNKQAMWDLNLIDTLLNTLCQHLPYHLPPCELKGLKFQLLAIKKKMVEFLYPPIPDKPTNPQ